MVLTAQASGYSKQVLDGARDLYDQSRHLDKRLFLDYQEYIEMRIRQEAFERKFGAYRAYADVIVRERPDIRFASEVLKQKVRL